MNPASGAPAPHDPAVESAAADWIVRHDRGLTPPQQDAFLQWLAARPAHREAFERHRGMWRQFDALARWRPEHGAEPNPDLLARPRRIVRWLMPATLAAAAAVVAAVWWQSPAPAPTEETVALEAPVYRQETLSDGTVVDLKGGAHLVVQFGAAERRVLLAAGEAQFTVARNPARPFVVRAGGVDVRAVGTAFAVKLAGPHVEVLVTEGAVQVARPATPESPAAAPLAALSAGQRAVVPVADAPRATVVPPPEVVAVTPREIAALLEWKPRLLDFDSAPLAEVIATFNRLNPVAPRLAIGDPALASLPVVGSIRSDNTEGFVRLLEATMGVRASRPSAAEIVLHRQP